MPAPVTTTDVARWRLLRALDDRYQELNKRHGEQAPRGGIPVGGGEWMDLFFRMEAIRGAINALRAGKSPQEAIEDGKAVSTIAVKLWNQKREYQVHRWEATAHDFLEREFNRAEQIARRVN